MDRRGSVRYMTGNAPRVMTPTGRVQTQLGNPPGRQAGPTQHLVPVGPPATYAGVPLTNIPELTLEKSARGVSITLPRATVATSPIQVVGFPRLDSSIIGSTGQPNIPWTQFLSNLWRFVQPTGIVPGTYAGIIFNAYGQAISASESGAVFDGATLNDPTFTGTVTAPTPPANDNSTAVATTAWVREQGYATEGYVQDYVGGQGFATETFVLGQGFATETYVHSQGFITDAPQDGNVYGRQNGQWVIVTPAPPEGQSEGAG